MELKVFQPLYYILNTMIVVHVVGGLGNQLFQIFAVLAYAYEHQVRPVIEYDEQPARPDRPNYWNSFLSSLGAYTHPSLQETQVIYKEPCFAYQPIPSPSNRSSIQKSSFSLRIDGYFQSYRYFRQYENQIFSLIRLREQQDITRRTYTPYFTPVGSFRTISVHFRLGDYKYLPKFHPILPVEYYIGAMRHILSREPDTPYRVLYFCESVDDDIVSQMISKIRLVTSEAVTTSEASWVKVNNAIPDWQQLLLMSCCDHQIIANSTFSWFGAYFNPTADKVVCYPSVWFGENLVEHDTRDLYPPEWTRIEAEINFI
jgi:hypothetical protein